MRTGRLIASGEQVVLTAGDLTLTVVTVGGGMRQLTKGDWHVLDGYDPDEIPIGAYGQPLIPWPNRLADGRYTFRGHTYQVPLTEPDKGNALHGFARWETWGVLDCDVSRAVLGLDMYPRAGYPFALSVTIEYSVKPKSVSVVTTAVNAGRDPLPYAHGFHPYISVGTSQIDECELQMPAQTWFDTDARQIPIGRRSVKDSPYDFRAPRDIASTKLDTAFTDLSRDSDGMARVRLIGNNGREIAVAIDQTYRYVMAFTADTLHDVQRRRRSLGVEPMTAAPNALQSGDGLIVLEPGGSIRSHWAIEIGSRAERTPPD
ncbi:MAG TPA: aldose 1-epimerase family protein [Candidatus Dormibacteraeota bacterium]|nr:aldose 1-epimerase family protein [Candidatus Dormibacteraeota bacterium]